MTRATLLPILLSAVASRLTAQDNIPIRKVVPDGKFAETFQSVTAIKQFRTGDILIDDATGRRILLFDNALARKKVVSDTTGTTSKYGNIPYAFIDAGPDSVYVLDTDARTLVMVGPDGTYGRPVAAPKQTDLQFFIQNPNPVSGSFGTARVDAQGRLIYRGVFRPPPPTPPEPGKVVVQAAPDTAPVLRGDFATRTVDTLAIMKIPRAFTAYVKPGQNGAPATGTLHVHPLQTADAWTVLTDGTVAIVRAQDYHIDWIDPDGSKRSTPKMQFAWRRLTETEKQYFADSAVTYWKRFADSAMAAQRAQNPNGGGGGPTAFEADTPDKMPDYISPIAGAWPDSDNRLWILPSTSTEAKDGRLYDVVDRTGKIVERVQLPNGAVVAGFGAGGVVFLMRPEGKAFVLERVKIAR